VEQEGTQRGREGHYGNTATLKHLEERGRSHGAVLHNSAEETKAGGEVLKAEVY